MSPRSPTCRWRRNLPCGEISDFNSWNFSTWRGISVFPHNRCGEMWIFAKFGEISHFSTGQMWRNLKFIQFFVIKSVLRCFCEIRFGAIYALLRGEKFSKKLGRWRKNDKYQVCLDQVTWWPPHFSIKGLQVSVMKYAESAQFTLSSFDLTSVMIASFISEDDILSGLVLEDGCDCTSETTEGNWMFTYYVHWESEL